MHGTLKPTNIGEAQQTGMFWIIPCLDTFRRVDLRTVSFNIPPQEVLTRDSVTIMVDGVVFYRTFNPTVAITKVGNADMATQMLAQTTLRNMLGTKNLSEILTDREEMADQMEHVLYDASKEWGIKVERVELKDVKLPQSMQRAMAAEAEASREARAKVIAAEGEMNASRALKEAAMVMAEAPSSMQLRYLQTLTEIASERNSTIVLTRDSVTIMVDGVVFYRTFNPTVAITKVGNADMATQMLAQTTLRNMLGTKNLSEILTDREEMADQMEHVLYDASKEWGIKVERVELKDVKLPQSMQRAMAAEAEASREARAKVIAAEGEMNASRALKEAAMVMAEAPSSMQLRYLQTLTEIASERNSTIVFPIPIDLITAFFKQK
ncbi:Erythrocyte band 7 integral membrane protein [Acipenser ruthenus]|uniref:Podocin n=1 Tax=Acipenser ruthenus TaxID=7906 RepID=A0A444V360_ACIRT|nr:Erythrocyte band 7 integral membrane protein [Acipenser ruthenus]